MRLKTLILLFAFVSLGSLSWSGLYFDEEYNNSRFKKDFNSKHNLIHQATSAVAVKPANDPTPYMGQFLDGNLIVVDPGYNRMIWNYYSSQQKSYGIKDLYDTSSYPRAIDDDGKGHVYITDVENNKIVKYKIIMTNEGHQLEYLMSFGTYGINNGEFVEPLHIAVAKNATNESRIYISDRIRHIIQVFDENGNFIREIGKPGKGEAQFELPRGMAVSQNYLYVADSGNGRIQKLMISDTSHSFVSALYRGNEIPEDALFTDIEFGSGGLYIVDERNNQIYLVDRDLNYITTYRGNPGSPFSGLKDMCIVPRSQGEGPAYQAITVEKKRVQSFRLGMDTINVRSEPAVFYPLDPVRSSTKLKYTLTDNGKIRLVVRDSNNNIVRRIIQLEQARSIGHHEQTWDGRDDNGNICASGTYVFELTAHDTNGYEGHAIKWVYKYSPIVIHSPPQVSIDNVSKAAIYDGIKSAGIGKMII